MMTEAQWRLQKRWATSPARKLYLEAEEARERVRQLLAILADGPGGMELPQRAEWCQQVAAALERGRAEGLSPR